MTISKINRYEIKSKLGAGGMATVFHAYDPSFERDVAIKVLPESMLLDPQFRTRFTREAKAIARLEHPAIVPVYDVGEENNQPYIVMRYMAGGSLADRLTTGFISLEDSAQIIERLAPALDAAHSQGIIHRDLKPGNVLFDNYGNSFLSDFGIARVGQAEGTQLTGNFILGTPAYMSPEQARGESDLDGRSDVYSLGATLFEMLSGRVPFESDTPMGQALKHIMEPTPNILELRPDLPIEVQDVIVRSMEKDRNYRYASASEMAHALSAIANREQGAAMAETEFEQKVSPGLGRSRDYKLPATELAQTVGETVASESVPQREVQKKQPNFIVWGLLATVLILFVVVGGILARPLFTGASGPSPDEQAATLTFQAVIVDEATQTDTDTPEPTQTPEPSATPAPDTPTPTEQFIEEPTSTPEIVTDPIQGGGDRIVYLIDNNIWSMNIDGSDSQQVTRDNTEKYALQFTPDGQSLYFISGKCLRSINIDTQEISDIVCYKYAAYFTDFDITPDGSKIALSLNNQLFIVPHDVDLLREADTNAKLSEIAECKDFAPYLKNAVTGVEWGYDGNTIAIQVLGILNDGRRGDIIQIIPVDVCIPNPKVIDNFPPPRFNIPEYADNPTIQRFTWDGVGLFALTTIVRNRVFGNLYFYNSAIRQGWLANPINDSCCYNDPIWSPDGNYLFFVYQNFSLGQEAQNEVYFIPYSNIEAKGQFTPLDSPAITNLRTNTEPAIRPANR
jgi:serine/threonine protein kinase